MSTFQEKIAHISHANDSLVCVGMDPPLGLTAKEALTNNTVIFDDTGDLVCCYKLNLAYYEALGDDGLKVLRQTLDYIPEAIPVILDGKWGDVEHTAKVQATNAFERLGVDAVTLNPYLGFDSVEPFLEYEDKGVLVLCLTSNESVPDFQHLPTGYGTFLQPLYQVVARKALAWNSRGNVGLVVGATHHAALSIVRQLCPDMLILTPGVGAQGGNLTEVVRNGVNAEGGGLIINASRSVVNHRISVREAVLEMRQHINEVRGP